MGAKNRRKNLHKHPGPPFEIRGRPGSFSNAPTSDSIKHKKARKVKNSISNRTSFYVFSFFDRPLEIVFTNNFKGEKFNK